MSLYIISNEILSLSNHSQFGKIQSVTLLRRSNHMVVLSAIGAFFARIWKWIKETAWIQPLLIVGIVFGVIFSINPIVTAITNLQNDLKSSETFYRGYQKSLVGAKDSDADRLTQAVLSIQLSGHVDENVERDYGSKFFIAFVSESCASCKETKGGFEVLRDNWDKYIEPEYRADGFRLYTIFTDEVTADEDTKETSFVKYMERNSQFFEEAAGAAYQSEYYQINKKISETDIEYVATCDAKNFLTPTILLVDFTDKSSAGAPGITEMLFGLSSDRDDQKAETLADCWQHEGDFKAK